MPWPEVGKKQKKKKTKKKLQKVNYTHSDMVNAKKVCEKSLKKILFLREMGA